MIDEDQLNLLQDLVGYAQNAGADAADAVYMEGISASLACRLGETEHLERSEGADLGLRVFCGQRQAIVSSSDVSPGILKDLAGRAVAMAKVVPEDPFCGIAEPADVANAGGDELDLVDASEPGAAVLEQRALEAEEAARAVQGVTNSEGAEAGWYRSSIALLATNGFSGIRARTYSHLGVTVLAGEGTAMEQDSDSATTVHGEDLPAPASLGETAGTRAVDRLNPQKALSATVPVVFDPRVAGSLLGHLSSAISGPAIARGTSFLKEKRGERVFPENISVVDDPLRPRGLRSRPFDGEGLATASRRVIDRGVLTNWTMSLRSARQLGLSSTASAARGTSSPPRPSQTNFYMEAGKLSPEELIADISSGLYVTQMMGQGVNPVTGDYSRGATGFWIENGEISYPVSEITIAGNLVDMFANTCPANDLEFRFGTNAPTLRIDGMTVAGK